MTAPFEFTLNDRPKGSRWWWYPETETLVRARPVGPTHIDAGGAVNQALDIEPLGPTTTKRIGFRVWLRLKIETRGRENEYYALKRMLKKVERRIGRDQRSGEVTP